MKPLRMEPTLRRLGAFVWTQQWKRNLNLLQLAVQLQCAAELT